MWLECALGRRKPRSATAPGWSPRQRQTLLRRTAPSWAVERGALRATVRPAVHQSPPASAVARRTDRVGTARCPRRLISPDALAPTTGSAHRLPALGARVR